MNKHEDHFDVVVAGGGIAGTMTAIAAASEGARTLLIERYAAVGGMATLGLVQPITMWGIRNQYVVGGRGRKLLERLSELSPNAATPMSHYGPTCDAEYLKRLLEVTALDAGVKLLYHTWVTGVEKAEDVLTGLQVVSKAGSHTIRGRIFVDATGDADVAAYAGVPHDEDSQGITLMFIVSGIDREHCPPQDEIKKIWNEHKVGYRGLALFWHPRPDTAYMNVTEVEGLNGLDPWALTEATIECRRQAWQTLEVLQTHVAGFERAYIEQTAPALGVRETRRIRGRYVLTENDVLTGADFPDTIARASCPVDVHGAKDTGRGDYRILKKSYGIPYRSITTDSIRNLLVTGRPISADHAAHSSLRRMAPGFALGEAAGIAAVLALPRGDVTSLSVSDLRHELIKHGAVLSPENEH
ncbi:MAG: FAD-dependent oxidoreductase [Victivallales bacterium]|jgi:2-polyprenyl-6-methoxyphenol hydroxylase-like FAD-dependent oxidoreductase